MKILIMVHNLTGGGAERVAALWATGFTQRGHQVALLLNCPKNTPMTYTIPSGTEVYNMSNWLAGKLYRHLEIDCYHVWKIRHIIKEVKPDVIIGVLDNNAHFAMKAVSRWKKKPLIIHTDHNSYERPDYAPLSKKAYIRKFVINREFQCVTVLTQADKEYIGNRLSNVKVMPNPLAYKPVESVPKKGKIILAAGRLDAWGVKGFDILIKAWGDVCKSFPEWKLQIAGHNRNNAMSVLQDMADKEDIGTQLEFLGYQSDMLPIYRRASVFVLSSRYEGFGMVLVEAMSQGCAPIACDYKGRQREIITSNEEGIICPVDDIKGLSDAIRKMILDEEFRLSAQKKAIERSKNYSLDNIMDRWELIINELINNQGNMEYLNKMWGGKT